MTGMIGNGQTHEQILDALARQAWASRPRLFAIYGVFPKIGDIIDTLPYLGWGLDLGGGNGALYWDAPENSAHFSRSAEQVLKVQQSIGLARLEWLDTGESGRGPARYLPRMGR